MSSLKELAEFLALQVVKKVEAESYGVILKDLPQYSYSDFVSVVAQQVADNSLVQPFIFFVGFTEDELREINGNSNILNSGLDIFYSVEEAERYRNNGEKKGTRVVIAKRSVAKLSSLQWYEQITAEDIYNSICTAATQIFKVRNLFPLSHLWSALKGKRIMNIISLGRLLDYYQYCIANDEKITEDSVQQMFRLGLLIDETLLVNSKPDAIRQKLLENAKLVARLRNLNNEDKRALQTSTNLPNVHDIRTNVLGFYTTRNLELLGRLKYKEVLDLLSKVKKSSKKKEKKKEDPVIIDSGDDEQSHGGVKNIFNADTTGVDLVVEHDQEQIRNILSKIEEEFNNWEHGKAKTAFIETDDNHKTTVEFLPEVKILVDTFVGTSTFGGVIWTNIKSPNDALTVSQLKHRINTFSDEYKDDIFNVLEFLEADLGDQLELTSAFNHFIELRTQLVEHSMRLADSPVLKISESDDILLTCSNYIQIYSKLLRTIREYYGQFVSISESGTKKLITCINSLDTVYIIGDTVTHAVLTPLNPLYLWKYVELIIRLKESSSLLNEDDKAFLVETAESIPNPLPTVLISGYISQKGDIIVPEIGTIGKLPAYSDQQQVNKTIAGLAATYNSLVKYIKVYPHSSLGLRVLFVNPPTIKHVLNIFKALLQNKEIDLNGAHIHIYRTKEATENWASLDDVDDSIKNQFSITENSNFSLQVHNKTLGFEELVRIASKNAFHTIVMFDPCSKAVTSVRRDPLLRIHPLCIPKVFKYDSYEDRVDIIPAADGNIFSDHHDLIAKLTNKPQGWHHTVVMKLETDKKLISEIAQATDWLIISDSDLRNLELSVIGSDKCIYYETSSFRDTGIYTNRWDKLINGMDITVRTIGNYNPSSKCIEQVLRTIQGLNEKGVLQLASSKVDRVFNIEHAKGALGTAISALWTKSKSKNYILVSLDTQLAQSWLDDRDNGLYSDLVGIALNEDVVTIDIVEVKSYEGAYNVEDTEISGKAVDQVKSIYEIIKEIFKDRDKITSTSRRELLRLQVFKAFYQLPLNRNEKKEWTYQLNRLFAGEVPIHINLFVHHVCFSDQGKSEEKTYTSVEEIKLVQIKDDFINKVLVNCDDSSLNNSYESLKSMIRTPQEQMHHDESVNKNNQILNSRLIKKTEITDDSAQYEIGGDTKETVSKEMVDYKPFEEDWELMEAIQANAKALFRALKDYSIDVASVDPDLALIAARFVRYRVRLRPGETLQKMLRYRSDISREIEAESDILIGNERGTQYVYVDVPRKSNDTIRLIEKLDMLPQNEIVGNLDIIVGQEPNGNFKLLNIADAPHLLTSGSTGSGKTIFLYSLIISLIHQYNEKQLELVIVDPKRTDFQRFSKLPHLRNGGIITSPEKAVEVLKELTEIELETRTDLLIQADCTTLREYNEMNPTTPLRPVVVIIDEYADLVQVAEMDGMRKDFERQMIRLAQRSRNVGINLVIATQRPSANVVTTSLKTNIPSRISFRLPAHQDSMTILDTPGAEDLLGKGDMLFLDNGEMTRLQGLFIDKHEMNEYLKRYN